MIHAAIADIVVPRPPLLCVVYKTAFPLEQVHVRVLLRLWAKEHYLVLACIPLKEEGSDCVETIRRSISLSQDINILNHVADTRVYTLL